jgi:hypothetical protein
LLSALREVTTVAPKTVVNDLIHLNIPLFIQKNIILLEFRFPNQ